MIAGAPLRAFAEQARQWWAEKPVRDAEWRLWANVPDLAHLRELTAWFCEGKLSFTPNHAGPRDPETVDIGDALAHANRSGFLTTNSQNGGEHDPAEAAAAGVVVGRQWRSCVEGLADDATAAKLRGLVAGTRLCLQVAPLRFFPQQGTVPGTHQKPDGTPYDGNDIPSWRVVAQWFQGIPGEVLSQVTHLNYVQIVDPKWGPSDLLWERLAEPDWDSPTPPPGEDNPPMPTHIPPGREDLWRRQAESDKRLADLDAQQRAAEQRAKDLAAALHPDDSIVEDADREAERLHDAYCREVAVNDRIRSERLAGLTSWIDHDPTAPICPDCQGTGGPPGHDAHGACQTCNGWGREHREPIPVWHAQTGQWINPATGHPVDLLAEQPPAKPDPSKPSPSKPSPSKPSPSSTPTTSTGAAMTSADTYSGLRGRIQGIAGRMPERQGPLQQVLADLDQDIAELQQINEDSTQAGIEEALGLLMQAKDSIEQAIWMVGAAQASTEGAAAGLA